MDDILGAWVLKVNVQPDKWVMIQSILKERFSLEIQSSVAEIYSL